MKIVAPARPSARSRLVLIAAGVLALIGSFAVTVPAQAGYYGDSYYGYRPCSYRCGYAPYRYDRGCSACGCWRRCHTSSRPSLVYERRYLERQYVERRYAWPPRHRHYGYNPYGYRSWSRPYPWGDGGVGRRWPTPYGYQYDPSVHRHYGDRYEPTADRYVERPPAPVWDGADHDAVPYGYQNAQWNSGQSWPRDQPLQTPYAAYGYGDGARPLPRGPLGMIESGVLGFLGVGAP